MLGRTAQSGQDDQGSPWVRQLNFFHRKFTRVRGSRFVFSQIIFSAIRENPRESVETESAVSA